MDTSKEIPEQIKTPITKEQFDEFCEITSTTDFTKKEICKTLGVSDNSIDKYIRIVGSDAERQYAHAKESQCGAYQQAIQERIKRCRKEIETEPDAKKCNAIVQLCKIDIEAIKWDMSKRLPKVFGDKIDVTSNGEAITREITITPIQSK